MAEFLVDKLLNTLADAVIKNLQDEFNLVTGVKDEVNNLSSKLTIIRRMLVNVQRRKTKEEPVGVWLAKLQDLAYDADDVLDEWNTEIQKLKLKAGENTSSSSPTKRLPKNLRNKVRSFLQSVCSCFKQVSVRHDIAVKIKEVNGRMNTIFEEADKFKFDLTNLSSNSEEFKRIITTSIFDESDVCGRKSDKDTIVSELLSGISDNTNNGIRIFSIVGAGGIGKTTLAQLVFNEDQVQSHFDIRKWICVSDPFDEKRIAKALLEEPGKSSASLPSELETLLQSVKQSIRGKRFLLVLDDVWTEDYNKWKPIWNSLKEGLPGSRILVTTRSERVARMMGTSYLYPLNELRDSDCWEILNRKAFLGRSKSESEKLINIGKEISKKCKGLPLAANFLGSLLQSKDTVEQWKDVLESDIWELEEATVGLFPHIYLSYNELSPEMKRCFLYCAIFPKDTVMVVPVLISMWSAQGYLSYSGRNEDLESKGYECFSNLAMRSFFQNFERDAYDEAKIAKCKMHDVVHDFAQHLTNAECLIIENPDEAKSLTSCEKMLRHLTWAYEGEVDANTKFGKLRSFCNTKGKMSDTVASKLFGSLKYVRALNLEGEKVYEIPRSIGNLIHLRYLNLRDNLVEFLPEEICELYNLETLDISGCYNLGKLPERIGSLLNLRHLLNDGANGIQQFPPDLEKLTSLRTLIQIKVGNAYNKFEFLRNLNQLGGWVRIEFFNGDKEDFGTEVLANNSRIRRLTFKFLGGNDMDYAYATESFTPPPNLEVFELFYYTHSVWPSWILALNKVRILVMSWCRLQSLPALGKLPSLEKLLLSYLEIDVLGLEFLGIKEIDGAGVSFPRLRKLEIEFLVEMHTWEDLSERDEDGAISKIEIMPCLEEIRLFRCDRLRALPHQLLRKAKSLKTLKVIRCDALREGSHRFGHGWIQLAHIPNLEIN